jgi:hypothetical protein
MIELLKLLSSNGKLLVAYLLTQAPGLSDYPKLLDALSTFIGAPTRSNAINIGIQAIFAFGAFHRIIKLLKAFKENLKNR